MEQWKESQLKQFSRTTEIGSAYRCALNFVQNIGFKYFSFSTSYPTRDNQTKVLRFNNFPTSWNREYEQQKMREHDPVVAHCNHSMLPIMWSEDMFSNIPSLWESMEAHGLQYGWSQSLHDAEKGLCSIFSLTRSHCPVTPFELYENLGFSVFIARHLHELVEQSLPKNAAKAPLPPLTPREVDVLNLAAAGKTAEESARILNLSPRTIHFHIQSAMDKLGAKNKVSAIIAAMKAGHLTDASTR